MAFIYRSTIEYYISGIYQGINDVETGYDKDSVVYSLSTAQDYAIRLGTLIESRVGMNTGAVSLLEDLCELIYQTGVVYGSEKFEDNITKMYKLIKDVENLINEIKIKNEVVILPYRYEYFDDVIRCYNYFSNQSNTDVYIIPIPYCDKYPDGEYGEWNYEGDVIGKRFPIINYLEYKISERFPDVIIIQNVQENSNYALSVHPDFYAEALRPYTENLIYISPFDISPVCVGDERGRYSLKFFVTVPGMAYADKIVVQSENVKNNYIDALSSFLGEDTRELWSYKVVSQETIGIYEMKADDELLISKNDYIPKEWYRYIVVKSGDRKKIVLVRSCISTFLRYRERSVEKLGEVFNTFNKNKESVVMIWKPDVYMDKLKEYMPEVYKKYQELADEYCNMDIGIMDVNENSGAIYIADAYYGDPCVEASMIQRRGKPVMIMNVNV